MTEPEIQRGVELYLAYFKEAQRLHLSELGRELEMYKDTDPLCIEQAFERLVESPLAGTEFIAQILHDLAWSQCLGNANHRTTMLFLVDFVETGLGEWHEAERLAQDTDGWIVGSQAVIRRRGEWGYNQIGLEGRHRDHCNRWVQRTLGQSEALMMSGPQRLLAFLSGSNSSSVRGF